MKKRISCFNLRKNIFTLCFLYAFSLPFPLAAQLSGSPEANTDNVFVNPNQIATWNVIVNDNPGNCSTDELTLRIITPPVHSTIYQVMTGNRIRYRAPNTITEMKDSLQYEIACSDQVSQAWVYIHIRNKPDNVETEVCHVTPPVIGWDMKELSRTTNIVHDTSSILCGDIDNDGETEIIVFNNASAGTGTTSSTNAILIFGVEPETNALTQKYKIDLPETLSIPQGQIAIGNVDGNGYAAIFYTTGLETTGNLLIKYHYDSNLSDYTEAWRVNYSDDPEYRYGIPLLADFGSDGNVQVQVYDKIFNARTGVLLADGQFIYSNRTNNTKYSFGWFGHRVAASETYATSCVAGDIDGDGKPEIIGGDCVYKVNITNHEGESGNSFTFFRRADNTPVTEDPSRKDLRSFYGATALADMDGDGQLDVIIATRTESNSSVYIYNPRNGEIMNTNQVISIPTGATLGPSLPMVGDGDGIPEIAVNGRLQLSTFRYNPQTGEISIIKDLTTTDSSASTTLTLFDFMQSGNVQLVYRDEDNLRILDPETMDILSFVEPAGSRTANEYPIVADVNNDGHAEIIAVAGDERYSSNASLRIYGSATTEGWAPARKVWHQNAYNPLYINDDLTIPQYPMNPAATFVKKDGTTHQPFNNFLQQATMLNDEGEMLWKGPDLAFSNTKRASIIFEPHLDRLKFTIYVSNDGDQTFPAPLRISTYVYDSENEKFHLISYVLADESIAVNETKTITYYIENYSTISFPSVYDHWVVFLNALDNINNEMPEFVYGTDECNYWNNYTDKISFSYGERVMCEGETEWMTIIPANTYKFFWYENPDDPDSGYFDIGDARYVTKNSDPIQRYYIDVYSQDETVKLTSVRDTVFVFMAPDSLIWTGSGKDGDWHNPANWFNPNSIVPNPYPTANIPRQCTNVLIPASATIYPDLSPAVTVYSEEAYTKSECNHIHFEHGGVIACPDSLHYNKAFVQLELDANRWYMLSSPLQHFYTGDYYVSDPNPHNDDVFVYTRLYAQPNPHTGETNEDAWGWTGIFHNPDVNLSLAQGISVWVDNKKDDEEEITSHRFTFPRHHEGYTIYNEKGGYYGYAPVERAHQHRFIFEPNYNASTGDVLLPLEATAAGEQILLGNPFMAHLSFEEFYKKNTSEIKNYYKILDTTDGNFILYTLGGASTATPPLNGWIAPMQAIIVEANNAFSSLTANPASMTSARVEETLRTTASRENDSDILTIEVYRGKEVNKTLLIYSPYQEDPYRESIAKTFLKYKNQAINIYTLSEEGVPLDLNYLTNLDHVTVPVGIRTSVNGPFRINVAGLTDFAREYDMYLFDKENPAFCQNLRMGSMAEFEKTSGEVFDNRFELRFFRKSTSLPERKLSGTPFRIYAREKTIYINTTDQAPIQKATVFDTNGRIIKTLKTKEGQTIEIPVPSEGIYLVHAVTTNDIITTKIIVP